MRCASSRSWRAWSSSRRARSGMAAHLAGSVPRAAGDDARVIVISGGNVDPELYLRILGGASA